MIDAMIDRFSFDCLRDFSRQKFGSHFITSNTPAKQWDLDIDDRFEVHNQYGIATNLHNAQNDDSNSPLAVFAIKVNTELSSRSCRHKQYELAKNCLRWLLGNRTEDGFIRQGIFVFHDKKGNFRFSLVSSTTEGTKANWSNFRRQTFFVEHDKENKTFRQRMAMPWNSLEDIKKAFSVEALTKEFYTGLFDWYQRAVDSKSVVFPNDIVKDKEPGEVKSEQVIRLITRLMFVWFIKQKYLVPEKLFDKDGLKDILKTFSPNKGDNYYRAILQNLFFATLNSEIPERDFVVEGKTREENKEHFDVKTLYRYKGEFDLPKKNILELFQSIPFLNGGLFECLDRGKQYFDGFSREENKQAKVPNKFFFDEDEDNLGLITLLSRYNFTVEENEPGDEDVALDPELLGKVFENLLGAYNPETQIAARNATGSFYTPREIVNYMVNESLIAHLTTKCGEEHSVTIRKLFTDGERPADKILCDKMDDALVKAKILDPACGSGAFPMGILLRMVELLRNLRSIPEENSVYDLKLELIENCIYGDDIQCIAVQISKLRFFISLVCEQTPTLDSKKNYGINPLPNLETKFVAADSLIGLPSDGKDTLDLHTGNIDKLKDELFEIRHLHFKAKTYQEKKNLRKLDKQKREEIKKAVKQAAKPDKERLELLEKERAKVAAPKWEQFIAPKEEQVEMFPDFTTEKSGPADLTYDANEKKRKELDAAIEREKRKVNIPSTVIDEIADKLAAWDPYDQNTSATFSDPEWMFNVKNGFDIVIGNPPFIDSEKMVVLIPGQRERLLSQYPTLFGNWDIYMAFYWYANAVSQNVICFITPDKWLSRPFGDAFRNAVVSKKLGLLTHCGNDVFDEVTVDAIITLLKRDSVNAKFCTFDNHKNMRILYEMPLSLLKAPYYFDYLFTPTAPLVLKIEENGISLSKYCFCENACAVSDAYNLVPLVKDASLDVDSSQYFKLVNTGTISKFFTRWGIQPITYLKKELGLCPLYPVVKRRKFESTFGGTYVRRAKAKKIILKGLNLLDACLDLKGEYIPGKSTLVLCNDSVDILKTVCALLNSSLAFFYYKHKFASCSYCGGLSFTPEMINLFPLKSISSCRELVELVDQILQRESLQPSDMDKINHCVYKLYNLTPEEIAIVDETCKKPEKAAGKGKKAVIEETEDVAKADEAEEDDGDDAMD